MLINMATKKNVTTTANPATTTTTAVATQLNNLHEGALHLTEALVDETLAAGKKWQAVMAKAMKAGVTIMGHQQELVFDTLESLKKQYQKGAGRAIHLVNAEVKAAKATVEQAVEEVTAEIEAATANVTKTTKGRPRKTEATVKNAVAKTTRKATAVAKEAIVATEATAKKVTAATRKTANKAEAAVTEVADTLLNVVEDKTAANN